MSKLLAMMLGKKENILYKPLLNGTEQITTMQNQNSPYISNNCLCNYIENSKGGSGYLSEGWDNTVLWELSCKARIWTTNSDTSNIQSSMLLVCNSNKRDYNLLNITDGNVWKYNGSSGSRIGYSPKISGPDFFDVVLTKIDSTTIKICVNNSTPTTIPNFTPLANTDRCYIGVDSWNTNYYAVVKDIVVKKID